VESEIRKSLLWMMLCTLVASIIFTAAMASGVTTPRILAVCFTIFMVVEGFWLYSKFRGIVAKQKATTSIARSPLLPNDPSVRVPVSSNEQVRVIRQIWLCRAFIGLMVFSLVFGWYHIHGAPLLPIFIGTFVNLALILGVFMRLKQLRSRLR
jgi:hypothetical protein